MVETQVFGGRPGTFFVTFVQLAPPLRVTCTLPSSVPAQMTRASSGDSEMVDRLVLLGVGVIHGHAAGLLLLEPLRIVGGEVGRDAVPGIALVGGAHQELA